jgi:hypothetical protein
MAQLLPGWLIVTLPRPDALADPGRLDGKDDADLVAASVPRVLGAQVAVSERLDVLRAALGGDGDDLPADRVIAGRAAPLRKAAPRALGNSLRLGMRVLACREERAGLLPGAPKV